MTVALRGSVFYIALTRSPPPKTEEAMPQDSGPEPKGEAEIAAKARRLLADVKSDPVPDKILQLARTLDEAIAERCRTAAEARKPR